MYGVAAVCGKQPNNGNARKQFNSLSVLRKFEAVTDMANNNKKILVISLYSPQKQFWRCFLINWKNLRLQRKTNW